MTHTVTWIDRLRIERVVWALDQRLYDLPRKSRIAKRREVRGNLRAAASDVGTANALSNIGNSRQLAVEYRDAEFGSQPRPSWIAALRTGEPPKAQRRPPQATPRKAKPSPDPDPATIQAARLSGHLSVRLYDRPVRQDSSPVAAHEPGLEEHSLLGWCSAHHPSGAVDGKKLCGEGATRGCREVRPG